MAIVMRDASRKRVKLRLSIAGASGSGKTMSALRLMYGLVKAEHPDWSDQTIWSHICLIDTENESASLYVGVIVDGEQIGTFKTINLAPPFEAKNYIEAIKVAEDAGMEGIIIDSLSHAWIGVGGALEKQAKIAARSGNSYTAWREVTPEHNKLVDTMLQSKCHVIACMRAKQEYEQVKNEATGKSQIKALGLGVEMRNGIEYEFTTAFMLDYNHCASSTKDRTHMFDGELFVITPATGKKFYEWICQAPEDTGPECAQLIKEITALIQSKITTLPEGVDVADRKVTLKQLVADTCGGISDYRTITDVEVLRKLKSAIEGVE